MQKLPSRTKFRKFRNPGLTKREKGYRRGLLGKLASNIQNQTSRSKSRMFIAWGVLMAAGLGLGVKLYNLQIVKGTKLTEQARNQQMVNLRPFMPRRPVVDRNSHLLAIDRPVYTLYAHICWPLTVLYILCTLIPSCLISLMKRWQSDLPQFWQKILLTW